MSSLAYCAAPYGNDDNNKPAPAPIENKRSSRNKTLKRRDTDRNKEHVAAMISQIHESTGNSDDMGEYNPPPPPESVGASRVDARRASVRNEPMPYAGEDSPVGLEAFDGLESTKNDDYYRTHVPYFSQMSTQPQPSRDELMNKLDHILHLLEEQQDERTGHVAEEVILYSFLGVFIIFVVDSFARAGKYVR